MPGFVTLGGEVCSDKDQRMVTSVGPKGKVTGCEPVKGLRASGQMVNYIVLEITQGRQQIAR